MADVTRPGEKEALIKPFLRYGAVALLVFFALWNLSKVPFYWEMQPMTSITYNATECDVTVDRPLRCSGLMTQYNLFALFGKKSSYKLMADRDSFVILHTALGIVLEVLFVVGLLAPERLFDHSKVLIPMAAIFALHIWPVRKGIPDSTFGAPVNEIIIIAIWIACVIIALGMYRDGRRHRQDVPETYQSHRLVRFGWLGVGLLVNSAPIGEWMLLAAGGKEPDPDVPHPQSGRDFYAGLGCPWLGRTLGAFAIFTAGMYVAELYFASMMGDSWRNPFSRKGPAIYQLLREPAPLADDTVIMRPEKFLEATGECFVLCIFVSWFMTSIFNPGIYRDNILRSIVGYNNLCVGFDSPPARYVAMPLLVFQGYLAVRYSYFDTIRLNAMREGMHPAKFWVGYVSNMIFAGWMCCFPMLLVVTAGFESWLSTELHLFLFLGTLIIMWFMIAGNFFEAPEITGSSKVWFFLFTAHTVLLPVVGVIDVLNFYPDLPADQLQTIRYNKPSPPVPWPLTAYLDFGWFALLMLAVVFLPDAPPLETVYTLGELGEVSDKASIPGSDYSESSSVIGRILDGEYEESRGLCSAI